MKTSVAVVVLAGLPWVMGANCSSNSGDDGGTDAARPRADAAAFGESGGQCIVECNTPADCCTGSQCGTGIFHFSCDMGKCSQTGCKVDTDCGTAGMRCATLGGFGLCGKACALPENCCPPTPPGIMFPPGQDHVTVAFDGGGEATFYKCGTYPQKFICTGSDIQPDDAGTTGICLRVCGTDDECPGISIPVPDAGTVSIRVDGGYVGFPLGDGGSLRFFQQKCVAQFGPIGQCQRGCETARDCCPDPTGATCRRELCVGGTCVADGCRDDSECSSANARCTPR